MCCCFCLKSCCWGLQDLRPGVVTLSSICISFSLFFLLTDLVVHGLYLPSQLYLSLLLLADLSLLLSAKTNSRCLTLPWLLLYLLHISLLLTVFLFLAQSENISLETTVKDLSPSPDDQQRDEETVGLFDKILRDMKDDTDRYFPEMKFRYLSLIFLCFSVFYSYAWITVKSFHRNIAQAQRHARTVELSEVLASRGRQGGRAYRY